MTAAPKRVPLKLEHAPTLRSTPASDTRRTNRDRPVTRQIFRHCGALTRELEAVLKRSMDSQTRVSAPPDSPQHPSVLIVDDQATNRVLLRSIVVRAGYVAYTANSGEHALEQLARHADIGLVLLDLKMPGIGGVEVLTRIRSDPSLRDLGVVVVTATGDPQVMIDVLDRGADDFLTSPAAPGVLLARLRSVQRLRKAERDARRYCDRLQEDLTAAQELQLSIIPTSPYLTRRVQAEWRYVPSSYVGGDVLDVFKLDSRRIGFYLADVSGHGVAAAMLAVWVQQFFRSYTTARPGSDLFTFGGETGTGQRAGRRRLPPNRQLAHLDKVLDESPLDRYLTAAYGVLDTASGALKYCLAGHPRPIVLRSGGTLEILDVASPPVGLGLGLPFELGEAFLEPGDRLFLHTDGLTEAASPGGEQLGTERFYRGLLESASNELWAQIDHVLRAVIDLTGFAGLSDDLSILGVQYTG